MTIENIYGIFCYLILILIFLVPLFSHFGQILVLRAFISNYSEAEKESSIHNHFSRGVLVVLGFAIVTRRGASLGVKLLS